MSAERRCNRDAKKGGNTDKERRTRGRAPVRWRDSLRKAPPGIIDGGRLRVWQVVVGPLDVK